MRDKNSNKFMSALKNNDIELIKTIPKGEFHNHSALGIDRRLLEKFGVIVKNTPEINSIEEMDKLSKMYVSKFTKTKQGFKTLIEGTIVSAINDGIVVLETSIDFRFFKFYKNNIEQGLIFLRDLKNKYQKKVLLKYDIGLSRKSYDRQYEEIIIKLLDSEIFSGIDIYGDEKYNDLLKFKTIYEYGKKKKLKLKAHVGEFGNEIDIVNTIKYLDLNVVQHGINIVNSEEAMNYAKKKNIIFNICPTSNIVLKRVKNIEDHPIRLVIGKKNLKKI